MSQTLPAPRAAVSVRAATIGDLPFIDGLQKQHTKQVGWMPTATLEGKIKLGHIIIAQDDAKRSVGYCIGNDQYFKRDDVGIIYQMNVVPEKQRSLIGATLVKAMFDRAAYGCKLFCCWCAQDIEANYFWESLGFIPLAFRAGSRGKGRIHIFWQRRIRPNDTTTPYWFPSQTSSGSIREDRLVFPIPPGVHWRDAMPIVLPGGTNLQLESRTPKSRPPKIKIAVIPLSEVESGGLRFARPKTAEPQEKPRRERAPKLKNDPRLVAAARELRDRWLENVNATTVLPGGKYNVSRTLFGESSASTAPLALPGPVAA